MNFAHPSRRGIGLAIVAVCIAVAACDDPPAGPDIASETYIDVMVSLRQAHQAHPDAASFEVERTRILEAAGVTDSALVAWVRARGGDPAYLAELWDTINARLMVVEEDSTAG